MSLEILDLGARCILHPEQEGWVKAQKLIGHEDKKRFNNKDVIEYMICKTCFPSIQTVEFVEMVNQEIEKQINERNI